MRVFSLLSVRATFRVTGHDFHARWGKIFSLLFLLSLVKMRNSGLETLKTSITLNSVLEKGLLNKVFYKEAPPWAPTCSLS